MRVLVSTAVLASARTQAEAVTILRMADLAPLALGPLVGGIATGADDIKMATGALLDPEARRPNLSAGDEDLRRRSVLRCKEALARAADLGIPLYAISPGWALEQTWTAEGESLGPPIARQKAEAQLERSLDALADAALDRSLLLAVINTLPGRDSLLDDPAEIDRVLDAVAAPNLRLLLHCSRLEAAVRKSGADPETQAARLARHLCGLQLEGTPPQGSWVRSWIVPRAQEPLDLVLAGREGTVSSLAAERSRLEDVVHAPA